MSTTPDHALGGTCDHGTCCPWHCQDCQTPAAFDHAEPCGCTYRSVDLPDDQWIGQGWRPVSTCAEHAAHGCHPCVAPDLRPVRVVR